ncbi:hypothetical protein AN640_03890 [Candidatus Epulonipiscium fishelsonii]|uniref:Uncharacterized protein n=1 Tax=Candidatus Epulonipiscium fishelsonii TaxID=77094 RepID=A0ACC8XJ28_9FIRM|nr:hypothetical protein AN640_03890 [Epulopiscium sp. SCG-D08WGA-EpuloA1]OON90754.1 MAG: hypothetical protein ATN32_03290 [Epulopiscium sp. AS2M-Bin002]
MKKLILIGISVMMSTGVVYATETKEIPERGQIKNFSAEELENIKAEREVQRQNKREEFVLKEDMQKGSKMKFSDEERKERVYAKLIELGYTQEELDENAAERKERLLNILSKYNVTEENFDQLQAAKKEGKDNFEEKLDELGLTKEVMKQIREEVQAEGYDLYHEFEKIERSRKTNGMKKLQTSKDA